MTKPCPEERAFLRAVYAAPGGDLPRLVFADWLEDHARNNEAAYHRRTAAGTDVDPKALAILVAQVLAFGWSFDGPLKRHPRRGSMPDRMFRVASVRTTDGPPLRPGDRPWRDYTLWSPVRTGHVFTFSTHYPWYRRKSVPGVPRPTSANVPADQMNEYYRLRAEEAAVCRAKLAEDDLPQKLLDAIGKWGRFVQVILQDPTTLHLRAYKPGYVRSAFNLRRHMNGDVEAVWAFGPSGTIQRWNRSTREPVTTNTEA